MSTLYAIYTDDAGKTRELRGNTPRAIAAQVSPSYIGDVITVYSDDGIAKACIYARDDWRRHGSRGGVPTIFLGRRRGSKY